MKTRKVHEDGNVLHSGKHTGHTSSTLGSSWLNVVVRQAADKYLAVHIFLKFGYFSFKAF